MKHIKDRSYNLTGLEKELLRIVRDASVMTRVDKKYMSQALGSQSEPIDAELLDNSLSDLVSRRLLAFEWGEYDLAD